MSSQRKSPERVTYSVPSIVFLTWKNPLPEMPRSVSLPVLASDHYGVRDTLPPEAGRLVHYPTPKKAPPLLAAALLDMLADRAKLKKMGEAARVVAEAMPFSTAADAVRLAALGLVS